MSKLLVKPGAPDSDGRILKITPESAGWSFVGFEVFNIKAGETLTQGTGDQEACLVLLSGKGDVAVGAETWHDIGERMDIFEQIPPWAVYVPNDSEWTLKANTDVELAVCKAPGFGNHQARLIEPDPRKVSVRGEGANTRHIHDILPDWDENADSLLVVEVFTPSGNWSSYPPHKHSVDNLPEESILEETYYHRINPKQGFSFQRVYNDDRTLDETMAVEDGNVVMVPEGYHPVGAPYGYDLYYLNVMAGPKRVWKFKNDPDHEWMLNKK